MPKRSYERLKRELERLKKRKSRSRRRSRSHRDRKSRSRLSERRHGRRSSSSSTSTSSDSSRGSSSLSVSSSASNDHGPTLAASGTIPSSPAAPLLSRKKSPTIAPQGQLPSAFLEALGKKLEEPCNVGDPIHEELAVRWGEILVKGLSDQDRKDLMLDAVYPNNVLALKSPQLNPEVRAAVLPLILGRDSCLSERQAQLGLAISSLGKVISDMLSDEKEVQKVAEVSRVGRLLCDLHNDFSCTRRAILTKSFDKEIVRILEITPIQEMLFGVNLDHTIKASKEIGKELKQFKIPAKKNLNSRGPAHRGARAGQDYRQRKYPLAQKAPPTQYRKYQRYPQKNLRLQRRAPRDKYE